MKTGKTLTERLYLGGGICALAGMALMLSVVFAGPGVLLLMVGGIVFLAGLISQFVARGAPRAVESDAKQVAQSATSAEKAHA